MPRLVPTRAHRRGASPRRTRCRTRDLIFFNGLGGFTPDGREYVITPVPGQTTPAPWVNVLANPHFGTVVSESGRPIPGARTRTNSASRPGTTTRSATPAAKPSTCATRRAATSGRPRRCRPAARCRTSAGMASATASSSTREDGIARSCGSTSPLDAAVKFSVLKVRNESGRPPQALGDRLCGMGAGRSAVEVEHARGHRDRSEQRRAVRAQPVQHGLRRPDRRSSMCDDATRTVTGDRTEFLGRNGTLAQSRRHAPRRGCSGKIGRGSGSLRRDPGRLRARRRAGARDHLQARRRARCRGCRSNLSSRFRGPTAARGALEAVWQYWKRTLGAVQVETPDASAQRAGQRLAAVPDAWPAASGRAAATTNRAARSASAISCRTRWRWSMPSPAAARASAAVREPSVPRRRRAALVASAGRAAACARISPTTISGCRWRRAAMC